MDKRGNMERARISPQTRKFIIDSALKSNEPREYLATKLQERISAQGEMAPSEDTLKKMISKAHNSGSSTEDYIWHLDSFAECPVPADALPLILEIQKDIDKNLSIRLVKWLTRIYLTLKGRQFLKENELFYRFYCYLWASIYADREKISEISISLDTPISFNTSDLDAGLLDDNPLSTPIKPFVLDLLTTGVVWLAGADEKVVSKEQKEHFGVLVTQKIEEALIGHTLGGSESGKPLADKIWLQYLGFILYALKAGYFFNLSKEETETLLLRIREALPTFWDAYRQSNQGAQQYIDILKSSFEKYQQIWDTLKIRKEE
jgi:hypothetical protein